MIKYAVKEDFERLKELWHNCFNDSYAFLDVFFNERFEKALIFEKDNKIISSLNLLKCKTVIDEKEYNSLYIYAACTDYLYRNQGFMGQLIEYLKKNCECDFLTLVPANEFLFDYYRKFGFVTFFKNQIFNPKIKEQSPKKISEATADEILDIREKALKNEAHIKWDKNAVLYVLKGNSCVLRCGNSYIIVYEDEKNVTVVEAVGSNEDLSILLTPLYNGDKPCKVNCLYSMDNLSDKAEKFVDKAMIFPLNAKSENAMLSYKGNAYFGLTLE
ncbi:MAG: GNAT family N-acetyltransferase [Clostridiales bacterium]|nr:GNAT family N-acetyltransferase [Clostridiales bacterium]